MSALATLALAILACVLLHLCAMAIAGAGLGLRLLEFRFGFGPQCLRIGRFQLGLLPLGGYVRFTELPEEVLGLAAQLLLTLAGIAALLTASMVLAGVAGMPAFVDGFRQWLLGAASPLGAAQSMLGAVQRQVLEGTLIATLGLCAAKLAAVNLLPWPGTNGGEVLAILGRRLGIARHWPPGLTSAIQSLALVLFVSWLAAVVAFAIRL